MSRAAWGALVALLVLACDDEGSGGSTDPADAADGGATDAIIRDAFPDLPPDLGPVTCLADNECPEDQYCRPDPTGFDSYCVGPGCKTEPDDCPDRSVCNPESRECERDFTCEADEHCTAEEYCDVEANHCEPGCRVDAPCPDDAAGQPTECEPSTHACTTTRPCCDGGTCFASLPLACDAPVEERSCFNPNPCVDRCDADEDCGEADFCNGDRFCRRGCREGGCPDGAACNIASRECELPRCAVDADCEDASFCAGSDECLLGCRREPDNCPGGSFCGPARRCEDGNGCAGDAECEARNGDGWYCEGRECQPPCRMDSECLAAEICEGGRCVDGCRGDGLEPNDDEEDAARLVFDGEGVFLDEELSACPQDRDWYRIDVPGAGWRVRIAVLFTHADGDLDARLHPAVGEAIAAQGQANNEAIDVVAEGGGEWLLEVFPRGDDSNRYTLRVELTPPAECVPDDAEEDGGDDTAADAVLLPSEGAEVTHRVRNRTLCEGDADWFRLQLGQGDGLVVRVFQGGNGHDANNVVEFDIFGPGMPEAGDEPTFLPNNVGGGGAVQRFFEFAAEVGNQQIDPGEYFIQVRGFDEDQWGAYELRVEVERNRELCLPDRAEPNGDADDAFDLMQVDGLVRQHINGGVELIPGLRALEGLSLCGDQDWFRLELRDGDDLDVAIERTDDEIEGDVQVEIRDANGDVVGNPGRNARADNSTRSEDLEAGVYWVGVTAIIPETESQYRLVVDRTAGPAACPADRFDVAAPNDGRGEARPIEPGQLDNLTLCADGGDEDWFVFETDGVADIEVELSFDHDQANLQLDVYRDDELIAENANDGQGHSNSDDELVALGDRLAGRYAVRVSALGAGSARYALRVAVEERAFVCRDDPDEPNESLDDAIDLDDALVERETQWICDRVPQEVDTFQFFVEGNATRTVAAQFLFGDDGDLSLDVYDAGGELLVTTAIVPRNNSKQCVVVEPFGGDRELFVQVVPLAINRINDDDERLDYTLLIQDGDTCDDIPPETPGVEWPRVPPPF